MTLLGHLPRLTLALLLAAAPALPALAENAPADAGNATAQQPVAPQPEVEAGGEDHDGCPFSKEKPLTG